MKKIVLVVFLAVLAAVMSNSVAAQQASDRTMLTYDVLVSEWNNLIGGVLDLTEAEAEAFWPVYEDYRAERNETINRKKDLLKIFVGSYNDMKPEMARILLDQSFAIEKEALETKMKYAEIFDNFLPPNKVTRLFQAENKLEVTMNAELVKDVPLAK
jgi:hypothetical protein